MILLESFNHQAIRLGTQNIELKMLEVKKISESRRENKYIVNNKNRLR